MTSNGSDRLTRIEGILESMAQQQEETRAIVNSNSRAIQAMMDQRVEDRLEHQQRTEQHEQRMQEHEQRMQRLEEILNRVANVQEGLGRMLVSLDDDRPTILRKLNSIENKVDRLLNGDAGGTLREQD
jgi:chromosome segregation ATPase